MPKGAAKEGGGVFLSPPSSYTQFAREILYEASDMERRLEKNYKSNRIR